MKNKGLSNRFPDKVRQLYTFWYNCFWCGKNRYDCLHHIISPSSFGYTRGKHNISPLNSAPLHNFTCHLDNGNLHQNEYEVKLMNKTVQFLSSVDYKYTDNDKEFFNTYYKSHYKKLYDSRNRPWS